MLALLASHVIAQTEPPQLGRVLIEYWTGIPYSSVDDLTSSPNYPLKPNSREYSTVMEIPQNLAVNSGDRLRGLFYVPANGTSTFYIASDNASQLWFSTDNNPTHATEIASVAGSTGYQKWTAYSTQKSISYNLTAGQVCYIKSRHKQGSGGGNMSIGLQVGTGSISLMPITDVAPYDAGVTYTGGAIDKLLQPFGHPRLMISPAAVARLAEEVTVGNPLYNTNQANSWGRISNVCTGTGTDLMPMGDDELKGPLIGATYVVAPKTGAILTAARTLQNRIYVLSLFYLVQSQLDINRHLRLRCPVFAQRDARTGTPSRRVYRTQRKCAAGRQPRHGQDPFGHRPGLCRLHSRQASTVHHHHGAGHAALGDAREPVAPAVPQAARTTLLCSEVF